MRSLLLPFLLVACTQPAPPPEASMPEPVNPPLVDTLMQLAGSAQPLLIVSDSKASEKAAEADDGCVEHIDASPAGVRVVQVAARDAMKKRDAELESTLTSAWMTAEQGANVSIADDFERGIATEHTDMPDTLDVTITYFTRCSARSPHTVRHFRVWRSAEEGFRWRER